MERGAKIQPDENSDELKQPPVVTRDAGPGIPRKKDRKREENRREETQICQDESRSKLGEKWMRRENNAQWYGIERTEMKR